MTVTTPGRIRWPRRSTPLPSCPAVTSRSSARWRSSASWPRGRTRRGGGRRAAPVVDILVVGGATSETLAAAALAAGLDAARVVRVPDATAALEALAGLLRRGGGGFVKAPPPGGGGAG